MYSGIFVNCLQNILFGENIAGAAAKIGQSDRITDFFMLVTRPKKILALKRY